LEKEVKFWDWFADKYDSFTNMVSSDMYRNLIKDILEHIDASKTVMEIATGTGIIAVEVAPHAKIVYASDISPRMIQLARDKLLVMGFENIIFEVKDAYQLDYPMESFDVVIASNVLHVLHYPSKVISSAHRVLKPGGLFIVAVFCHGENLLSKLISSLISTVGFKAHQKWSVESFRHFIATDLFTVIMFKVYQNSIPMVVTVMQK
jgi:ubiquinone/menaquinone biosynthesis C-methylase UbiE